MFHKEQLKFIKLCLGISKIQLQQSNEQLHDTSNPGSVKPGSLKSARLSRKLKIVFIILVRLMLSVTMRVVLKAALRTQSGYIEDISLHCFGATRPQ